MKYYSICKIGGREQNDDTSAFRRRFRSTCLFVGDGLGGYAGGFQASSLASKVLLTYWEHGGDSVLDQYEAMADLSNKAVLDLQQKTGGDMKTTIVFLGIRHGTARWMHVGDSRLYHFRDSKIVSQTLDHSMSRVAVQMGEIRPEEIRFHQDRNKVFRALGSEAAKPEISNTVSLRRRRDVFLLCTDGFWEYVKENEMEQLLSQSSNPKQWIQKMEALLLTRVDGTNDNYTASALFY